MAEAEPSTGGGKRKSSFMGMLFEWLLITLIAGGAGVALTAMNPPPTPSGKPGDKIAAGKLASEKKDEAVETAANCGSGGPSLVDMPPIVTNIASPPDSWVRLEGSILFDPKTLKNPEVVAAEIATDELAYLRTVSVSELQGPIGLENIRPDLRDRALVRSGGKVTDLLLKTLVLQ
jgi:flagellar FliL protein